MAKKDKSQVQDKKIESFPERKSGVMKLRVAEPPKKETLEIEKSLFEGEEETQGILGSRAEILTDTLDLTEKEGEDEDVGKEDKTPPKEDKVDGSDAKKETLPKKFEGKSFEDVVKAYSDLESLTTRLAQTNVELNKKISNPESSPAESISVPDDLSDQLIEGGEKAKKAVENLVKSITEQVTKKVVADAEAYNEAKDINDTKEYLQREHSSLLVDERTKRVLDALAGVRPEKTYLERYKGAIEDYKTLRGEAKVELKEEVKKEVKESEDMKASATSIKGKPGSGSKKIWKQSDIDTLCTDNPAVYAKLQGEIAKAYMEGRVRRDL